MAVTGTETIREIVTDALLDIGVGVIGGAPESEDMAIGIRHLNRLMKSWQGLGYMQFLHARQTITLTTAASYTMSPVRPLKILTANLKRGGIETPMFEMMRSEYDELPQKTSTGLPTQFYYDKQKEAALFYVWPVLSTAAGETIEITYEREFEDIADENDTIDIPAEFYDAVVKNLAARLALPYEIKEPTASMLKMDSRDALDTALASDAEGSVYWMGKNA